MTYLELFTNAGYKVFVRHYRYYPGMVYPKSQKEALEKEYFLSECESRGGYTSVEVYRDDKLFGSGESVCSVKDNYNKKFGRELALERTLFEMLNSLKEENPLIA